MASELRVNTLKDASGNNSVGMSFVAEGTAKAWMSFNGTGSAALRDSFNPSSLTDNSTGNFTQTLSNAMGNASFSGTTHVIVTTNGDCTATGEATAPTTTTFKIGCRALANTLLDPQYGMTNIHGDLA